jgi:hypothetical protein
MNEKRSVKNRINSLGESILKNFNKFLNELLFKYEFGSVNTLKNGTTIIILITSRTAERTIRINNNFNCLIRTGLNNLSSFTYNEKKEVLLFWDVCI